MSFLLFHCFKFYFVKLKISNPFYNNVPFPKTVSNVCVLFCKFIMFVGPYRCLADPGRFAHGRVLLRAGREERQGRFDLPGGGWRVLGHRRRHQGSWRPRNLCGPARDQRKIHLQRLQGKQTVWFKPSCWVDVLSYCYTIISYFVRIQFSITIIYKASKAKLISLAHCPIVTGTYT